MASNDMHVVIYKILAYLYACMKSGDRPQYSCYSSEAMGIPDEYWKQIMCELVAHRYIEGVNITNGPLGSSVYPANPRVTMDGVEFLMENSMMAKAKQWLIDAKSTIPFI